MQGTGTADAMVVKGSVAHRKCRRRGEHPAGLDVYAPSHPHLKAIIGTRGSVLSKRLIHVRAGLEGEVVEGGLEGEANPNEGEARSLSRNNCLVAGGDVSVISAQRP